MVFYRLLCFCHFILVFNWFSNGLCNFGVIFCRFLMNFYRFLMVLYRIIMVCSIIFCLGRSYLSPQPRLVITTTAVGHHRDRSWLLPQLWLVITATADGRNRNLLIGYNWILNFRLPTRLSKILEIRVGWGRGDQFLRWKG